MRESMKCLCCGFNDKFDEIIIKDSYGYTCSAITVNKDKRKTTKDRIKLYRCTVCGVINSKVITE